jgi:hypothetical protein
MESTEDRRGLKSVSNWQRQAIKAACSTKNRTEAAELLGIKKRTFDDLLYRAYIVLDCRNLKGAAAKLGIPITK